MCNECNEDNGNYEKPVSTYWKTQAESAVIETLESRVESLKGKLQDVVNWSNAYPLDIFPEPDFKKVRAALEAADISLDHVSASIMRHVVTGVGDIARAALSGFKPSIPDVSVTQDVLIDIKTSSDNNKEGVE